MDHMENETAYKFRGVKTQTASLFGSTLLGDIQQSIQIILHNMGDGGITESPFDANIAGNGELEFWNPLLENSVTGFDGSPVQCSGKMLKGISSGK